MLYAARAPQELSDMFQPFLRFYSRRHGGLATSRAYRFQPFLRFYRFPALGRQREVYVLIVSTLFEILHSKTGHHGVWYYMKFQPFLRFYRVRCLRQFQDAA